MLKSPLAATALKYGAVAALFSIIIFFILLGLDHKPFVNLNGFILDAIILVVFMWMAVKEFKSLHNSSELRFWQGMSISIIIFSLVAVVYALFVFIYLEVINPEYFKIYQENASEVLKQTGENFSERISKEEIDVKLADIQNAKPWQLLVTSFFKKLVTGMLLAPVVSIINRK